MADKLASCIEDMVECDGTSADIRIHYAPIISWLQANGLVVAPNVSW